MIPLGSTRRRDREPRRLRYRIQKQYQQAREQITAVKMYVEDIDQRDWDEYAERLTFALNTA
ncbi:reverse transcriptase [Phytophthora palmivora]|uniref:Reverse transcriptase n=1 Tax=Phytophthora palmivora TaxID=4796 RepID=A0A2P4XC22_9STRA|nr:reverse transcriptase [Phytophthora palmivora]